MAFITEWLMPVGDFTLPLRTGFTYNMIVSWGDGTADSTVTAYNAASATHNYAVAGTYQISITGTCGAWYINNSAANKLKISKVIDWGNVGFTGGGLMFAFSGCSNLIALPAGPITGTTSITYIYSTFANCSGLTSIPAGIFNNVGNLGGNGFTSVFKGCTALTTLPTDLFRYNTNVSTSGFESAFEGCINLTTLPTDLFRYNTAVSGSGFKTTFKNCTSLNNLPADLFRYNTNTAASGFSECFYGCTALTTLPTDLFRYNTAVSTSGFNGTFNGCTALTTLPTDLFRYNTAVSTLGFSRTFYNCSNLATVPENLFLHNVNCVSFLEAFLNCSKLQLRSDMFFNPGAEETRFLNKNIDFTNCFKRSSFTGTQGTAPELWTCNFGTGTATKTGCFNGQSTATVTNYCYIPAIWGQPTPCPKLFTFLTQKTGQTTLKLIAVTSILKPAEDEIKFYFKLDNNTDLKTAPYLVSGQTSNNITFESTVTPPDNTNYFCAVEYYTNGILSETLFTNGLFLEMSVLDITYIDIINPANHITLQQPNQHSYNHGLIFYNGFLYGSARGSGISPENLNLFSIFKIQASDYSNKQQINIYRNKNTSTDLIYHWDQIIQCAGFIWVYYGDFLVRINPADLDYIVFSGLPATMAAEPLATDGNFIFIPANQQVHKLDTSKLTGTFVSYGYDGSIPIALPNGTIIASCDLTTTISTYKSFVHSSIVDSKYLYLAATSSSLLINGYDSATGTYIFHLQKIDKNTMQTVGDVTIPKCTDDMVQDGEWVYLAPEYQSGANDLWGASWGLLAVNKLTLELKYLKALHYSLIATAVANRAAYGVFYFNNKIAVQLISSRTTIIINTENVEQWGDNFPIAGATEAIYKFKINGVGIENPCNELVLDNSGYVHTNTWDDNTIVFKFNLSQITTAEKTPNIATTLISTGTDTATVNGYIIDEGKSPVTSGGFKWGPAPEALTNDLPADPFSYDFTEAINSLASGIYYAAAYGVNTEGTFYGNTVMFAIENSEPEYNAVSLQHNDTIALLQFLDGHFGCSIRCVQDAPGVATGTTGTVTDQDGNTYDTVVINEKRWMVQNLKTKKYRNGDAIPEVAANAAWQELSSGGYCNVI